MASLSFLSSVARFCPPVGVRTIGRVAQGSTPKSLPIYMNLSGSEATTANPKSTTRMLILGKPCTGKGTLASRLCTKYNIRSLSTGDLLRQHIVQRSNIGKQAEEIVASGGLLPDELMLDLVTDKLDMLRNKNWVLDGFPRTQRQARLLDNYLEERGLSLSLVVNVDLSDEVILKWIADRLVHVPSGRVYSTSHNPPRVPGIDDITGEPLTKRPDDDPEIFSRRLDHYYSQTSPLLYYYASRSPHATRLVNLDCNSDMLWPTLDSVIQDCFPTIRERAASRPRLPRQMQIRSSL